MANLERYFPVVKTSSSLKQKDTKKSASRYNPYETPTVPRDGKRFVKSPVPGFNLITFIAQLSQQTFECCAQQVFIVDFEGCEQPDCSLDEWIESWWVASIPNSDEQLNLFFLRVEHVESTATGHQRAESRINRTLYLKHRREKLKNQEERPAPSTSTSSSAKSSSKMQISSSSPSTSAASSSSSALKADEPPKAKRLVMEGVRVYINGYLCDTTDIEMKRTVTLAGGQVLFVLLFYLLRLFFTEFNLLNDPVKHHQTRRTS